MAVMAVSQADATPPGWGEVWAGLAIMAFSVVVYAVARAASAVMGGTDAFRTAQRLCVGFFAVLGVVEVMKGIVHLI